MRGAARRAGFGVEQALSKAAASGVEALEARVLFVVGIFAAAIDNDVAFDAGGNRHLAYFDGASKTVELCDAAPGAELVEPITIDAAGDVGRQVSSVDYGVCERVTDPAAPVPMEV
jgi:hypothetical protein